MKTATSRNHWRTLYAFGITLTASSLALAGQNATKSDSAKNSGKHGADNSRLELSRSTDVLGRDVLGSDGKKVGDIVDMALDLNGTPHITHVLIMSGGFLDMGGDTRAVPVDAINERDGSYRVDLASDAFYRVPVVTNDRQRFFSDSDLVASVDKHFGSDATKNSDGGQQNRSNDSSNADNPDKSSREIRMLSDLTGRQVRGSAGGDLGRIEDVWVSLEGGRAPFVQIRPGSDVGSPFEVHRSGLRYVIPTAEFKGMDAGDARFDVTSQDLQDAPTVSALDWVNRPTDGSDAVLRIDSSAVGNGSGSAQKNDQSKS